MSKTKKVVKKTVKKSVEGQKPSRNDAVVSRRFGNKNSKFIGNKNSKFFGSVKGLSDD